MYLINEFEFCVKVSVALFKDMCGEDVWGQQVQLLSIANILEMDFAFSLSLTWEFVLNLFEYSFTCL